MLALVMWLCAWWGGAGGVRPAPLDMPRCCPPAHQLAPGALRAAGAGAGAGLTRAAALAACRPTDATATATAWAPLVYAPARGAYLERGRLPAHWRVREDAVPACEELRALPEHAAPFALLANNASLLLRGPPAAALPPDRYCVDAAGALVCAEDVRAEAHAVKCCTEGFALEGARCVRSEAAAADALRAVRALAGERRVGFGWPVCGEGPGWAAAGGLAGARLAPDGALELAARAGRLAAGAWCGEALLQEGGAVHAMACESAAHAVPGSGAGSNRHVLYGAALALGALCLAATLAAGCALPAAHHALHWRCQTHYVAALMLGDALLAATHLAAPAVPPLLCRALAVCMHFLFLSAFFWLNTMCFNIWWTFRDFRPTSLERGQEAWRLRVYMLYAWGGPLLVAGAAALLDARATGATGGGGVLRPRFGEQRCWFYGDLEILVYFFGPVGVLLLVNLALFASTARQLACGLWRRDDVKSTSERAALGRVCAKLVVVMGVTWGADVVSWAAGGPEYVWYATDLLNALQGLLIFLVVGCQPHAWAALRGAARRWATCACWRAGAGGAGAPRGAGGRRPRAHHAHSSTHLPSVGESLTHTTHTAPAPAPTAHTAHTAHTALSATCAPAPAPPAKIPMETVC